MTGLSAAAYEWIVLIDLMVEGARCGVRRTSIRVREGSTTRLGGSGRFAHAAIVRAIRGVNSSFTHELVMAPGIRGP